MRMTFICIFFSFFSYTTYGECPQRKISKKEKEFLEETKNKLIEMAKKERQSQLDLIEQEKLRCPTPTDLNDMKRVVEADYQLALEQVDIKIRLEEIKSYYGEDYLKDKLVPEINFQHYRYYGIINHAAVRMEKEEGNFLQFEVQPSFEYEAVEDLQAINLEATIKLFGVKNVGDLADIMVYLEGGQRDIMARKRPLRSRQPICVIPGEKKKTFNEYYKCFENVLEKYDNVLSKSKEQINYDPMINNCGHFGKKILKACGLTNCFDFSKKNGLFLGKGVLEDHGKAFCYKDAYHYYFDNLKRDK